MIVNPVKVKLISLMIAVDRVPYECSCCYNTTITQAYEVQEDHSDKKRYLKIGVFKALL